MDASRFIAGRLRFKGKLAMVSIAVSFLVMIIAVSVSSGFRKEIRSGVSSISGDIQLTPSTMNYINEDDPVSGRPSYYDRLTEVKGVKSIAPVVYRAGIIKNGENIHGVLFKGVQKKEADTVALGVTIPSRLADVLGISVGDRMLTYFVGDRVKVRKFTVTDIYQSLLDSDDALLVYASIDDMRRLNDWEEEDVSALEITLDDAWKSPSLISLKNEEIGSLSLLMSDDDDDSLVATSVIQRYPQLFSWLNLIDFNVLFILVLMTIVAGFNMISGLLILLFRNISTIGILKSMGMTDRNIASVFLRVSSQLVLKGMAIGNALALLFCLIQGTTHMLKLNPANYFVSFVPVAVNVPMIILADVISYLVIMVLLLIPSLFISKVDPAKTVRAQ